MATFKVACPNCHTRYDLTDAHIGALVECQKPDCRAGFYVDRDGQSISVQLSVTCPTCSTPYGVALENIGKINKCVNCGNDFRLEHRKPAATRAQPQPTVAARPQPKGARQPQPQAAVPPKPTDTTRRRMYLFERAYGDYASRIVKFGRRLMAVCGVIWNWFWRGRGANVIEVLLRVCVVASGITFGVLYVMYEKNHGRGFSVGMFFAFLLIAGYVSVLMWGWKAPVHVGARAASGAIASGSIAGVALLAMVVALAVFAAYLLGLFVLTALSFLVFVPMRTAHSIWLLYRKIAYHCPYDICPSKGLPIHVCSCGHEYADLKPSFYGIFHHICRHPDGTNVELPTMDFLGRNKLPRLCCGCRHPLIHSSLGDASVKPIAIVGGPSAGKTVFQRQAARRLMERLGSIHGSKVHIDAERQAQDFHTDLALLDQGQVLAKTAGDVGEALGMVVHIPKRLSKSLLYIYDAPGESFATMDLFGRKQALQNLSGIILLVDPFSLPMLYDHGQRWGASLRPSANELHEVVQVLIAGVNQMLVDNPTDKCAVPLAVAIGKADALPADQFEYLARLRPDGARPLDQDLHDCCRTALVKLGEERCVRLLEQKFSNVRYFACSALGRMSDPADNSAFRPVGVDEPFLWLLGLDGTVPVALEN